MQGVLSGGSGLRILPRRFPIPPSLPQLPPFLPSSPVPSSGSPAALRQKVSSHLFLKRLRRSWRGAAAAFLPAPRPPTPTVARGSGSGGHRRFWTLSPAQGRLSATPGQLCARWEGVLPLWGALFIPAALPRLRCETALPCKGRCQGSLSLEGCELLSSGCWFSPSPLRLVFSASPRCRWPPASELSALLTRARKSALTASGHCVSNGNCRAGAAGYRCPGRRIGPLSLLPFPQILRCSRAKAGPEHPRAPEAVIAHGHGGQRLGSAVVWPLSLLPPVSPGAPQGLSSAGTKGQGVGIALGLFGGK